MKLRLRSRFAAVFSEPYWWFLMLLAALVLYGLAALIRWGTDPQRDGLAALLSAPGVFYGRMGLDVTPPVSAVLLLVLSLVAPVIAAFAILDFLSFLFCPQGQKGCQLARQLAVRGEQVVVVEVDENNENLTSLKAVNAFVIKGNAEDPQVLEKAGLLRAKTLVLVAGSDSSNMNILMAAASLMRRARRSGRSGRPAEVITGRKNEDQRLPIDLTPWEYLPKSERQKDVRQINALAGVFLRAGLPPMEERWAEVHRRCEAKGGRELLEYCALGRLGVSGEGLLTEAGFQQAMDRLRRSCQCCRRRTACGPRLTDSPTRVTAPAPMPSC